MNRVFLDESTIQDYYILNSNRLLKEFLVIVSISSGYFKNLLILV